MKKLFAGFIVTILIFTMAFGVSAAELTTVYAADGRSSLIYTYELDYYKSAGWYEAPVMMVYAADGRESLIYTYELDYYKSVGWYEAPVMTIYLPDGTSSLVYRYELDWYKSQGWYEAPVMTVYAPDGRSNIIYCRELEAYKNVGWYETYTQAQSAKVQSQVSYQPSNTYSYESYNYDNQPNSGGSAVYRTPSGKRYHYDPNCGGPNSYSISFDNIGSLTPCKKCVG